MVEVNHGQDLALMLQENIRTKIAAIAEEEVEACKKRIQERIGAEIDTIALNVLKTYDITMGGNILTIKVSKRELENPLG